MLNYQQRRKFQQDKVCTMSYPQSNMCPLHSLNTTTALQHLHMSQESNLCTVSQPQESKSQQGKARIQQNLSMTFVR